MEMVTTEVKPPVKYAFTQDWFTRHVAFWEPLLKMVKPTKILEVGSFEGRSTVWLIERCIQYGPLNLVCIDSWTGGEEHVGIDFNEIEDRFNNNITLAVTNPNLPNPVDVKKMKGWSHEVLASLLLDPNQEKFDLIYIDGSHQAADVLLDAVMSFKLLRVGGVMIFDDWLITNWEEGQEDYDLLHHPQIAIKAFMTVYGDKIKKLNFKTTDKNGNLYDVEDMMLEKHGERLYQMYATKIAE
jgi:cephalosporin hydroxylase